MYHNKYILINDVIVLLKLKDIFPLNFERLDSKQFSGEKIGELHKRRIKHFCSVFFSGPAFIDQSKKNNKVPR